MNARPGDVCNRHGIGTAVDLHWTNTASRANRSLAMSLPVSGNTTAVISRIPTGSAPTPGSDCNTAGDVEMGVAFTLDITHATEHWFTWPITMGVTYRVTYTKNSGAIGTVSVEFGANCGSTTSGFIFASSPGDNSFVALADGNGYLEVPGDATVDGNYTICVDTVPPTLVTTTYEVFLKPAYVEGVTHNQETESGGKPYTHIALFSAGADVRDGYQGNGSHAGDADTIKIPDANGTSS